MKKAGEAKAGGDLITGKKREISMVADDQNWRSYVANELKGAEAWNQDWGFLVAKAGTHITSLKFATDTCFRRTCNWSYQG